PHVSQLRQARGPVVATRDGTDLPSRVAESLFWLGRYGERLDARARLLREALLRLMEYDQDEIADQLLDELLLALDITTLDHEGESTKPPLVGFAQKRTALLTQFDERDAQALQPLFAQMLRNARSVREHLGDDSWRVVHQLRQRVDTFNPSLGASAARRACEGLSAQIAAFFGLCNETMPHHYGWRFMDIGRFLDRVLGLLSLLKLTLNAPHSPGLALWEVVLATTDNFTAYRRRYRSELHPEAILDLLLFDETNPRSVGYMLKRLERQMDRLPGSSSPYRNAERRLLIQANAALHLADIDRISHLADTPDAQAALEQLLDELIAPLNALSDAISHSHFSHVEQPRQLVSMEPDE
ncbi:MAG: alpha-E domain-containing protein, partial [Pseudomonadota bacterium]|nr:alpha-E domain-containing protein [Pseudomonadota bacterium]